MSSGNPLALRRSVSSSDSLTAHHLPDTFSSPSRFRSRAQTALQKNHPPITSALLGSFKNLSEASGLYKIDDQAVLETGDVTHIPEAAALRCICGKDSNSSQRRMMQSFIGSVEVNHCEGQRFPDEPGGYGPFIDAYGFVEGYIMAMNEAHRSYRLGPVFGGTVKMRRGLTYARAQTLLAMQSP